MSKNIGSLIAHEIGGGWGQEAPTDEEFVSAAVIRGTDLPSVGVGDTSTVPRRFHRPSALASRLLQPGDIVFEVSGGSKGQPVGRSLLVSKTVLGELDEAVICASFCKLIRINPALAEPSFVYRLLQAAYSDGSLGAYCVQSTGITNFKWKPFLSDFTVELPDRSVQHCVTTILDAIDDLIVNNRRRIALLEQMAQAIYREWFVHFRYPGHEDDELVDSSLGPIPDGWDVATVGEASLNFDRLRKPLSAHERSERPGSIPYYGAATVIDYIDDVLFTGDYLLVAEDGSVITANGFPILQRVRGQFWVSNHAHVIQGSGRITTTFLQLSLAQYPIDGHVTGAAQPKVTQANLNRIPLLLAPPNLMCTFSDTVEDVIDARFTLADSVATLERIRDLLLPKLVTGAIDVSRLDLDALLADDVAA